MLTLVDFFTDSALLSLLEVLAALGELRPLERTSSAMGEARPSGLAACFFLPLRRVDIWGRESPAQPCPAPLSALGMENLPSPSWRSQPGQSLAAKACSISPQDFCLQSSLDSHVKGGKSLTCLLTSIKC